MRSPVRAVALPVLLVALVAAGSSALRAADQPAKGKAAPAPKPALLFFMNPDGRPCQMQDQILTESRAQCEPLATLRYVKTTDPADRELFYRYGIRSLPNLLLVGADGKELYRSSPGIQSAETVLAGIRSKTAR